MMGCEHTYNTQLNQMPRAAHGPYYTVLGHLWFCFSTLPAPLDPPSLDYLSSPHVYSPPLFSRLVILPALENQKDGKQNKIAIAPACSTERTLVALLTHASMNYFLAAECSTLVILPIHPI